MLGGASNALGLASSASYFASGNTKLGLEEVGSTAINLLTFGAGRIGKLGSDFPGAFGALIKMGKEAEDTMDSLGDGTTVIRTATNYRNWSYLMAVASTGPAIDATIGWHPQGQLYPAF